MNRLALLIGSPEQPEQNDIFYKGVNWDIENFTTFLISPTGGAWDKNSEIKCLKNPSKSSVLDIIRRINVDYVLIYFSGHGRYSTNTEDTYLKLNDTDEISVNELLQSSSSKQLIIVDACRTAQSSGYSNWGLEGLEFSSNLDVETSRFYFYNALESCQNGCICIYSCRCYESASADEFGGFYTSSLFKSSNEWTQAITKSNILSTKMAFSNSTQYLQQNYPTKQIPEIQGAVNFPFAIKEKQQ
ncbi:MAG: hypothetical protein RL708_1124 [Bacteroidota bacterium]|jgi:hypothetical protein